jgi:cardiolipin synthase A/B
MNDARPSIPGSVGPAPESMVDGNRLRLLRDGREAFPAMLEAIAHAEREVLLEMYWFGSDRTGWMFAEALMRKARQGCDVRVIYDAVGSWESSDDMFDALRGAGCGVFDYHPIAPWRRRFKIGVVNSRNHRKMLVVDGATGFTGGINIGDPWAPAAQGGQDWRDDVVRVQGPAVQAMRDLFRLTWKRLQGAGPQKVRPVRHPRGPQGAVRVLANQFQGEGKVIRQAYLQRIRSAQRRIFLSNSYFVPDSAVRHALAAAARRGVDVRVLLPGESDLPAVQYASQRSYAWLLERGVKLHEWQGTILHAKSAVIDGCWSTIGTYNLDWRSWRFNLEIVVTVDDPGFGRTMEQSFERDLETSVAVDLRHWRYRAMSDRLMEELFFLFRKLL